MKPPSSPSRRQFLAASAALGASLALPRSAVAAVPANPLRAGKPGKLLILGGTRFLGPAVVHDAKARGWEITLFNRGKSDPGAFPELEHLIGDRDGQLDALKGRDWDAVVDTSGYVPRHVRDSAELLKDHCGHYVFVSTVSVYDDKGVALNEDSPLGVLKDPSVEQVTGETYGPLK
ncbi:MAG: epimerase, partial [Planctomycetota bacterium]|nr:epimerase [Planctomycetota bacterium]